MTMEEEEKALKELIERADLPDYVVDVVPQPFVDSMGDDAIYFYIIMSDDVTDDEDFFRKSMEVEAKMRPLEQASRLGLQFYHTYRGKSEQDAVLNGTYGAA